MSRQRRHSFILIEVIIAISLFAILLSVLFGIFSSYIKTDQAITKARGSYEKRLLAQVKLQRIFAHTEFSDRDHHYFYLDDDGSLVFTYDNKYEIATQFPNTVLAKLYVDPKNRLNLAIWEHSEDTYEEIPERFRKDFILDNVEDIEFEFFKAPLVQKEKGKKTNTEEDPNVIQGKWVTEWEKKLKCAPTLLKITLKPDDTTFWFVLPKEITPAVYDKRHA
jgi:type II secretory pathway pseudopilin PulG